MALNPGGRPYVTNINDSGGASNTTKGDWRWLGTQLPVISGVKEAGDAKKEKEPENTTKGGWLGSLVSLISAAKAAADAKKEKEPENTTNTAFSDFRAGNQQYRNSSQKLSDRIYSSDDFLKNLGVEIMSEAKKNPLETDWGKSILDYYGIAGDAAASSINASRAGENAGNIDSYAAANAERQRLAKLGQGVAAVSGMSGDRVNSMLSVLDGIGVNTANLLGIEGQYNLPTLTENNAVVGDLMATLYGTDASSTAAYNELIYGSGTPKIVKYSDNAIMESLKEFYKNLDIQNGGDGEIDWTATDPEIWTKVKEAMRGEDAFSPLTIGYLDGLIAQIMQKGEEE